MDLDPSDDPGKVRVSIWNTQTQRKVAGMAAPMQENLQRYLRDHSHCEVYTDQEFQEVVAKPKPKPKATPAANRTKPVAERVAEPMELAEEQTPLVNCTTSSGRMSQKVQRYQPILSGSGMGNERGDVQRSSNAVGFCNFQLVDVSAEPPSHPNVAAAAAAECSASGWRRNGRGAQAGCCAITDDFQAQDPPRSRVVLLREIAISPACG